MVNVSVILVILYGVNPAFPTICIVWLFSLLDELCVTVPPVLNVSLTSIVDKSKVYEFPSFLLNVAVAVPLS